jgi:hypothetical protein
MSTPTLPPMPGNVGGDLGSISPPKILPTPTPTPPAPTPPPPPKK